MTTARLCLAVGCLLLGAAFGVLHMFQAGLRSVLAIIVLWPVAGILLFVHARYVRPLAQARRELLAVANGAAPGAARPHFGRGDEIGQIGRMLAALQAGDAQRERLRAELAEAQARLVHAQQAAEARERFMDALLDALPMPLSLHHPDGRFMFVNRAWERAHGALRHEVTGRRGALQQGDMQAELPGAGGAPVALLRITPTPAAEDAALLHAIAEPAALLLRSPLDDAQRRYAETIAALATARASA